jgi:uncharacterized membrane protein
MKKIATIGRILFAIPFGIMGLNHFLMTKIFLEQIKTSYIPGEAYTILITGILLIVASISIILNKNLKTACFWLAGLLLIFILTIHIPGLFTANWEVALIQLLKDTGLMGGAVMIAVYSDSQKDVSVKK